MTAMTIQDERDPIQKQNQSVIVKNKNNNDDKLERLAEESPSRFRSPASNIKRHLKIDLQNGQILTSPANEGSEKDRQIFITREQAVEKLMTYSSGITDVNIMKTSSNRQTILQIDGKTQELPYSQISSKIQKNKSLIKP